MKVPGAPIWLPGGGAGSSGDDFRAPKSTLGVLGRRFRVFGGRFGATLKRKFNVWENFGDENLLRWKIFDHVLVPNERSGSLYLNHHYDFRFGVAMCFEKRFGVEREEASSEITLTLVAIETL